MLQPPAAGASLLGTCPRASSLWRQAATGMRDKLISLRRAISNGWYDGEKRFMSQGVWGP